MGERAKQKKIIMAGLDKQVLQHARTKVPILVPLAPVNAFYVGTVAQIRKKVVY